jgi:hypothetical protein
MSHYRSTCHVPGFRPNDVFRDLYGYACTEVEDNFGNCQYADKKRFDIFEESKTNANGSIVFFRNFGHWLLNAMTEAMFLHTVCLPFIGEGSCLLPEDDLVFHESLDSMKMMFKEVGEKIDDVEKKFLSDWRENLLTNDFFLFGGITGGDLVTNIPATQARVQKNLEKEFGYVFSFQAIVYKADSSYTVDKVMDRGISTGWKVIGDQAWVGGTATGNGAVVFDNAAGSGMNLHIRYRKKKVTKKEGVVYFETTEKEGAVYFETHINPTRPCEWKICCRKIFCGGGLYNRDNCETAAGLFDLPRFTYRDGETCYDTVSYVEDSAVKAFAAKDEGYLILHGTGSGSFFEHWGNQFSVFREVKIPGFIWTLFLNQGYYADGFIRVFY